MNNVALILGCAGQDGSYLADLLLAKGYTVHGTVRRTSSLERSRLAHLYNDPTIYNRRLFLHYADMSDGTALRRLLTRIEPQEVYHLAGQSHVGLSFDIPESTCEITANATLGLLEILRDMPSRPRFYHASSSEVFGRPAESPQNEETPFRPVNPYGCAKAFATQMVRIYRESFGLFAVNGIAYNHESPRRGENFVSRKICRGAAAAITRGGNTLQLGDVTSQRDWGDAREYVEGMWLALQHAEPHDFVFATGVLHRVQEIVEVAFDAVGLSHEDHVRRDEGMYRPSEPQQLVGDSSKALRLLGWKARNSFESLIREMTLAEVDNG